MLAKQLGSFCTTVEIQELTYMGTNKMFQENG